MQLVHYSAAPVAEIRSAEQPSEDHFKPRGFWVSDDACEDNWRSWCEAEGFRLENLTHVHDVALAPDANILHLSSAYEIDAFTRAYSLETQQVWRNRDMDWRRLAREFQGIIITPYVWARRLDGDAGWYCSWDCASGCIWDARAITSIALREIRPMPEVAA